MVSISDTLVKTEDCSNASRSCQITFVYNKLSTKNISATLKYLDKYVEQHWI